MWLWMWLSEEVGQSLFGRCRIAFHCLLITLSLFVRVAVLYPRALLRITTSGENKVDDLSYVPDHVVEGIVPVPSIVRSMMLVLLFTSRRARDLFLG